MLTALLVVAAMQEPVRWFGAGLADTLPTDRAQLARLARRHPCPRSVPPGWTRADPTLGAGPRCSLVVAAAAAVGRGGGRRGVPRIDLARVTCVQVLGPVWRDLDTRQISEAYWSVTFVTARDPWANVRIARPSGRVTVAPETDEFVMGAAATCRRRAP